MGDVTLHVFSFLGILPKKVSTYFLQIFLSVCFSNSTSFPVNAHISTKKFFKNPLGKEGAPEELAKKTFCTLGNPRLGLSINGYVST